MWGNAAAIDKPQRHRNFHNCASLQESRLEAKSDFRYSRLPVRLEQYLFRNFGVTNIYQYFKHMWLEAHHCDSQGATPVPDDCLHWRTTYPGRLKLVPGC